MNMKKKHLTFMCVDAVYNEALYFLNEQFNNAER